MLLVASMIPQPVLWLRPDGAIVVPGRDPARLLNGTAAIGTPHGIGLNFDGNTAGVSIPDSRQLHLTGSITIAAWVYARNYVGSNNWYPSSQILFRGDDRPGIDPYHLTIMANGTVVFGLWDSKGNGPYAQAPLPIRQWTHVMGSYDVRTSQIRLWIDGVLAATGYSKYGPLGPLDANEAPGVSLGNVQAPWRGRHSQPLDGILADVRLYNRALTPQQIGITPSPHRIPEESLR